MNILIGLYMLPLQVSMSDFAKRSNTTNSSSGLIFAMGIGVLVIVLVILNVYKNKIQTKGGGKHLAASGPRNFSGFTLHRLTSDLGLDREQVKMLEYVLRSGGINDPERFLNSPDMIDRHFKRAYRLIERTSSGHDELNDRLAVLFSTRNIIDSSGKGLNATSSRQIPEKVPAVLTVDKVNYPVKVISSRGDTLIVENPKRAAGSNLHLPKGSKATLAFFTKSSKGFLLETRVLGSTDSPEGPALQLAHSGQIKKLSSRRFRRRQIIIATVFYFVRTENKKMTVDKIRRTGNIMDISIGGCSIKTTTPVSAGQKLKVEFTHADDSVIAALGEVLRTSRSGMNNIIHIKFLKVPRRSLNSINAMVYEYDEK